MQVALAVFADRRRGVVVEHRTGEVVDHQHLPLQCILDQERHTIQPLALLEHIHTHAHTHQDTYTQRTQAGRPELYAGANMCTCGHARTKNTQENAYNIEKVIKLTVYVHRHFLYKYHLSIFIHTGRFISF